MRNYLNEMDIKDIVCLLPLFKKNTLAFTQMLMGRYNFIYLLEICEIFEGPFISTALKCSCVTGTTPVLLISFFFPS